jgi:hypothetical protein
MDGMVFFEEKWLVFHSRASIWASKTKSNYLHLTIEYIGAIREPKD